MQSGYSREIKRREIYLFWIRCEMVTRFWPFALLFFKAVQLFAPARPTLPSCQPVNIVRHSHEPKRNTRIANSNLPVRLFLLTGFLLVLSGAVSAQVDESDQKIDDPNDSQNWSQNWSEGWKERQKKKDAIRDRLTHWQLSERTLLTFYGQVNVGQLTYEDEFDQKVAVRDNPNSPSRIGLRMETEYENGRSLFLNLETAVPKDNINSVFGSSAQSGNDSQWDKSLLRKAEGRLSLPNVGYFSLGQGSMAADGITGFDFSKTTLIAYNSVGDTVTGVPARLTDGTETSTDVSSFFPNYDAARRMRFRFDSLSPSGISWAASVGREVLTSDNDTTYADVAIRYETKWRRFGVKGGIGYAYNGDSPGFLSGSVAGLDDETGLNFAIAFGASTAKGRYVYGKAGIIRNIFKPGWTAFSADYYISTSPLSEASGSQSWGVAVVQKFETQDLELYATYRDYTIDGAVLQYADSRAIFVGARFSW